MKNRIGILVSILAALGSAGLGHVYFQRLEAEVSGGPKVSVLVAAQDIPVGAPLSEKVLAIRDIPTAYVEGRHVRASELKKVLGARVAAGLKANEAVQWNDLTKYSDHVRVLSGLVKQGMRAVAIDGRSADFNGLLRPGDRVDVLFTDGGRGEASRTTTFMQNLLVLAVGENIQRVDEDARANARALRMGTVSVSATVEQAQRLIQAQQEGRLTLTLRNSEDITIVEDVPEATSLALSQQRLPAERPQPALKRGIERVR